MASPRFQIFVSSTFRDLIDERRAALDAILEMNHFPAGMEMFPASDFTPSAIIERVIRESDYYVLIVGGRYGSTDAAGISYTEREYDYAVQQGKSVLAFLHGSPDLIPAGKSEMDAAARAKLDIFRKRVEIHHCKYWRTADELKSQVVIGLLHAISTHPAVGWVRADVSSPELLAKLVSLQEKYDATVLDNTKLRQTVNDFDLTESSYAFGDDSVDVEYHFTEEGAKVIGRCAMTWGEIFLPLARNLFSPLPESRIQDRLTAMILKSPDCTSIRERSDRDKLRFTISDAGFYKIKIQFLGLNLIQLTTVVKADVFAFRDRGESHPVPAWVLTPKGIAELSKRDAVRRPADSPQENASGGSA